MNGTRRQPPRFWDSLDSKQRGVLATIGIAGALLALWVLASLPKWSRSLAAGEAQKTMPPAREASRPTVAVTPAPPRRPRPVKTRPVEQLPVPPRPVPVEPRPTADAGPEQPSLSEASSPPAPAPPTISAGDVYVGLAESTGQPSADVELTILDCNPVRGTVSVFVHLVGSVHRASYTGSLRPDGTMRLVQETGIHSGSVRPMDGWGLVVWRHAPLLLAVREGRLHGKRETTTIEAKHDQEASKVARDQLLKSPLDSLNGRLFVGLVESEGSASVEVRARFEIDERLKSCEAVIAPAKAPQYGATFRGAIVDADGVSVSMKRVGSPVSGVSRAAADPRVPPSLKRIFEWDQHTTLQLSVLRDGTVVGRRSTTTLRLSPAGGGPR